MAPNTSASHSLDANQGIYMGGISQDAKRLKMWDFLPFILWAFLTIYIFVVLIKITMCLKQLEASHIMSWDS